MRGAEDTARVVGRARGVGHAGLSRPHNSGSGVSHGFTPSSDRKSAPLGPPFSFAFLAKRQVPHPWAF